MLKIKNKNVHRLLLLIAALIALLIAATYLYSNNQATAPQEESQSEIRDGVNYSEPTDEQIDTGIEAKKETLKEESENISSSPSINITSASQHGDLLQVRTTINSLNSGKCTLTAEVKGAQIYHAEADTQILGTYMVCQGFDVPLSGLEKGEWSIEVSYANSDNAHIDSDDIQVEIK